MSIARGEGPRLGEEEFRPGHQVQDILFTVLARGGLGHREVLQCELHRGRLLAVVPCRLTVVQQPGGQELRVHSVTDLDLRDTDRVTAHGPTGQRGYCSARLL